MCDPPWPLPPLTRPPVNEADSWNAPKFGAACLIAVPAGVFDIFEAFFHFLAEFLELGEH
jgi:hypothetical protein